MRAVIQDNSVVQETATESMRLPDWVPVEVAARIAKDPSEIQIRLATDERMKAVWRELRKHKPIGKLWLKPRGNHAVSDCDIALAMVFCTTWWFATITTFLVTSPGYKEWTGAHRSQAKRLQREADELWQRWGSGYYYDAPAALKLHVEAIKRAAEWCEEEASYWQAALSANSVIQRDHGKLLAHGLCRNLTKVFILLYGKRLRGTVATLASVALAQVVTVANVRDWTQDMRIGAP